jgi:hypothetical protein
LILTIKITVAAIPYCSQTIGVLSILGFPNFSRETREDFLFSRRENMVFFDSNTWFDFFNPVGTIPQAIGSRER